MPSPNPNNPQLSAQIDDEVGAHYEDSVRAAGLARLYESETPLGEFYRERMGRIADLLEGVDGKLLDAGCGTGQMIRFLRTLRPGAFVFTGLDRSASIIDVARETIGADAAVSLVVARLEEMPFAAKTFDVVLAMGSLEYVTSPEKVFAEIARVTRPGGIVIVTMQNRWSPYRLWDTVVWSHMRRRRGQVESPIVHRLDEGALTGALTVAGLAPLSVVHYGFNVFLPPLDQVFPQFAIAAQRRLSRAARGSLRRPLRRLANDYLVVAQRNSGIRATAASSPRRASE